MTLGLGGKIVYKNCGQKQRNREYKKVIFILGRKCNTDIQYFEKESGRGSNNASDTSGEEKPFDDTDKKNGLL
jgi:hypothetical protein